MSKRLGELVMVTDMNKWESDIEIASTILNFLSSDASAFAFLPAEPATSEASARL